MNRPNGDVRSDARIPIALGCIALIALAVRVLWLVRHGPGEITWDGAEYARTAQNFAAGLGYLGIRGTTNFVFPPLYSMAIAALLPLTGNAIRAGVAVSLLSGTALIVPLYALGATLFTKRTGLIAAAIAAVFPFAVQLSTVVLSDMLYLALVTAGLAALARAARSLRARDAIGFGIAFGLAYLTRPEGVLVEAFAVAAVLLIAAMRARRRVPMLAVAALLPFALLASPYVTFLSFNAGHVRIEGKSLLNLDIGLRMDRGMTYAVAADAIDDRLNEVGPELRRDYYFEPEGRHAPAAGVVAAFAVKNMVRHAPEIAHVAVSRICGTIVFALLAFIGLLAGSRTRASLTSRALLLAYAFVVAISLSSVYHFWERYFIGFVPVFVVFAARGIDVLTRLVGRRLPFEPLRIAVPIAVVFLAACTFSTRTGYTDDASTTVERQAGRWLALHDSSRPRVLAISDQAPYYANATWSMLPWSQSSATALRYVRKLNPDYVVLNSEYASERPYVGQWLSAGVPDRAARPIYSIVRDGRPVLTIVKWQSDDEARR